ncbi:hypothetical protein BAUCODRAFT_527281 [Baudoinia panamericana UAMH 10762]|uniref:Fumarylacetoacetase n=1 Tax=Baudoinia panamericana (strain UAMH 10762) TaxID=717646 RepID=M2LLH9_BAUPA|nr:uncharacterized protein BAUCODRAFT_527281 [Baudoinia panamericana UAMH 10762]EMC95137.1 hypothetical protein BAUCODRAFT_527281 [Baudoinia panamericana UAMH 10762]
MAGSWVESGKKSDFSISNIPFGIISNDKNHLHRPAIAIGDHVLDLQGFAAAGGFAELKPSDALLSSLNQVTLNDFATLGRPVHRTVRKYIQEVLAEDTNMPNVLRDSSVLREKVLFPLSSVKNHLPMAIGDYTDFFAGRHHAFTVGSLFRGPDNALQPNYHHLPVGYHGRASSVVVSGTALHRPRGQILADPTAKPQRPTFEASKRLDIELELACFVGKGNAMGKPVSVKEASEHIFGYVLMNDWSARDIQTWEYVPLGPFNAKNFGTTISPWIVLADALNPYMTTGIANETPLLEYLQEDPGRTGFELSLEVDLAPLSGPTTTISRTSGRNLMWSFAQMIAHHTVGGCPLRAGDLLGSGTISGLNDDDRGSLLEMSKGGKTPFKLSDGSERVFLKDNDSINIRGWAGGEGASRVGFGHCSGTILPAIS